MLVPFWLSFSENLFDVEGQRLAAERKSRLECRNVSSSRNFHEFLQQCREVSRTGDAEGGSGLKVSRCPPVEEKYQLHFNV
jgi:hypothetical protein